METGYNMAGGMGSYRRRSWEEIVLEHIERDAQAIITPALSAEEQQRRWDKAVARAAPICAADGCTERPGRAGRLCPRDYKRFLDWRLGQKRRGNTDATVDEWLARPKQTAAAPVRPAVPKPAPAPRAEPAADGVQSMRAALVALEAKAKLFSDAAVALRRALEAA